MDRILIYSFEILNNIKNNLFTILCNKENEINFAIFKTLPAQLEHSYYLNEQSIDPNKKEFEDWREHINMRTNTTYSVAIINNRIISSVCGSLVGLEQVLNLWHTQESNRGRDIGKGVLLNFIKHIFETETANTIRAWDITSASVDNILLGYGFN